MKPAYGSRVGALMSAKDTTKVVEFLGYGVYEGDEVPPKSVGGFNMGLPNPKIKLDNGKVVWGCECWWGPEEEFKENLTKYEAAGWTIKTVDIDEYRLSPPSEEELRHD